jgi:hypothetical protein
MSPNYPLVRRFNYRPPHATRGAKACDGGARWAIKEGNELIDDGLPVGLRRDIGGDQSFGMNAHRHVGFKCADQFDFTGSHHEFLSSEGGDSLFIDEIVRFRAWIEK